MNTPHVKTIDIEFSHLREVLHHFYSKQKEWVSYPLGFYRLSLQTDSRVKDGFYIHYWSERSFAARFTDSIHTHIFDLKSKVFIGRMENHTYKARKCKNGSHQITKVIYSGNCSERTPIGGSVCLDKSSKQIITEGECYEVAKGQFHNSVVTSFPCISLIQKSNVDSLQSPLAIVADRQHNNEVKYDHEVAHSIDVWEEIMEVI